MTRSIFILISSLFFSACNNSDRPDEQTGQNTTGKKDKSAIKPATIFTDTLKLSTPAAVFYYPDSNQLNSIKSRLDPLVYDALIHEYSYQVQFAKTVLHNHWPKINTVQAKKVRYLLFIKADKSKIVIDLDTKYDPFGLFVFDPAKDPSLIDMTNAENQIAIYFADISTPGTGSQ